MEEKNKMNESKEHQKEKHILIHSDLHKEIKLEAVSLGKTMNNFLNELLVEYRMNKERGELCNMKLMQKQ